MKNIAETNAAYTSPEKVSAHGPVSLSDAELLSVAAGVSPDVASSVLAHLGGLRALLDRDKLAAAPGMTSLRAARVAAGIELSNRILAERLSRGDALTDPEAAGLYFARRLRHREHEVFAVLFMDTKHRTIAYEELFYGSIDGAEVHPRVLAKRALRHNAAAVILAHNHPSGEGVPSAADKMMTARIKSALSLIDVRLLDHFIIGDDSPVSMAVRGLV